MAIDICNKAELLELMHCFGDTPEVMGGFLSQNKELRPLDSLTPYQKHAYTLQSRSLMSAADPRFFAGDPAAWASDFGYAVDRVAVRLDMRTSSELTDCALTHADPMMREQALFEYIDRNEDDSIELLCEVAQKDADREVRWDALWAIEKLGGKDGFQALGRFTHDADPEIAEWAGLFRSELESGDPAFDGRACHSTPGRTFDETIHLLIHCDLYIRLDANNREWGKLTLSPLALARVYGSAHACPNVATRERQLVIAKRIDGLHSDGTPHIDNYLFRGFTERTQPDRGNFYFESSVPRPFFLSGQADNASKGVEDATISFMRSGCWHLEPRFQIHGEPAIRYVRGKFQGWGYFDLARCVGQPIDKVLTPGNAILSSLHHPVTGPMTNAFISGTFKGKLNDWDGDGKIDLNSRDVFSTVEGELDTDMDGIPDEPGVTCCTRREGLN